MLIRRFKRFTSSIIKRQGQNELNTLNTDLFVKFTMKYQIFKKQFKNLKYLKIFKNL